MLRYNFRQNLWLIPTVTHLSSTPISYISPSSGASLPMYSFKFQTCKCLLWEVKYWSPWRTIFSKMLGALYARSEITLASKSDWAHCKVALESKCSLIFLLWKEALSSVFPFMFPLNTETFCKSLWNFTGENNKMLPLDSPHFNDWIGTQHIVVAQ